MVNRIERDRLAIHLRRNRIIVISEWPVEKEVTGYQTGHILDEKDVEKEWDGRFSIKQMPLFFKGCFAPLKWYEYQLLDDLLQVDYVRLVAGGGYNIVGDVVPVIGYDIDIPNRTVREFKLGVGADEPPQNVIPATETEYKEFKKMDRK